MKLESYAMREALAAGDTAAAVRLLATYYALSEPCDIPVTVIAKNTLTYADGSTRLLFWCGDYFYEWSADTGFDSGIHNYPLEPDVQPNIVDKIILWI